MRIACYLNHRAGSSQHGTNERWRECAGTGAPWPQGPSNVQAAADPAHMQQPMLSQQPQHTHNPAAPQRMPQEQQQQFQMSQMMPQQVRALPDAVCCKMLVDVLS